MEVIMDCNLRVGAELICFHEKNRCRDCRDYGKVCCAVPASLPYTILQGVW